MKKFVHPDCIGCLFDQLKKVLTSFKPEISYEEIITHQKELMKRLVNLPLSDFGSPNLGKVVYGLASEILGVPDPYKKEKVYIQNKAKDLYPKLKNLVEKSKNPLLQACIISIMGNALDLGAPRPIDIENDIKNISDDDLKINDFTHFEENLEGAQKILIIGDNTGEIFFDKVLIEEILRQNPKKEITYSVRSGPIINDSLKEDAIFAGIEKICNVIENTDYPGIILEETTPEFQELFYSCDLIIMKGQGNFESAENVETNGIVYFFLKAKCHVIEEYFDIPLGGLILMKKRK